MGVLESAWSDLGGDPRALDRVERVAVPLASVLPAADLVHDAVAAASAAAAVLGGDPEPVIRLDPASVATAVTSERHLLWRGAPPDVWSPLSGFWPTADGWLRTHANYPHHRERLLAALGLGPDVESGALRDRLASGGAVELESVIVAAGGVAAAVRSESEWARHPQAIAVGETPLLALDRLGAAPKSTLGPRSAAAPAAGLRVLDLTRVIAGPVATRTLALAGADVVRVDPPHLPEPDWQHGDTGAGKRSVVRDVASADFAHLLAGAHVVVLGYRGGALARHGLDAARLAREYPGLVVASLTAWGEVGPWAERRGFDSIVQAASGIALVEGAGRAAAGRRGSRDGQAAAPAALPAQALDHSAGYLLAAGILAAVGRTLEEGGSWRVRVSLARVAAELLAGPRHPEPAPAPAFTPTTVAFGDLVTTAPAPRWPGGPTAWPAPPVPSGSSEARWR